MVWRTIFSVGNAKWNFLSQRLKRFASFGTFVNGMCSACNSIPKIDFFLLKLQRRSDSWGDSAGLKSFC